VAVPVASAAESWVMALAVSTPELAAGANGVPQTSSASSVPDGAVSALAGREPE